MRLAFLDPRWWLLAAWLMPGLGVPAAVAATAVADPPPPALDTRRFRDDEIVVRFRDAVPAERRRAVWDDLGAVRMRGVGHRATDRLRLPGRNVREALDRLNANPDVVWAEPNYVVQALAVPDDPRFGEQWALRNEGQTGGTVGADIRATLAWDLTPGSRDVLVGVLDTGMDYRHPDLAPNLFVNPGEVPDNGVDDDGNGYVDDIHGWDFIDDDNDPMDLLGHGTHVAGIIGAAGNNALGVSGVSWRVSLLPLRFLGSTGGSTADAAEAIRYATRMGVRFTNNSWGGEDASQAVRDAIVEARDAGVLFVAAAGNAGRDNALVPTYPASFGLSNIVSVAATDDNDQLASFSNYGATTVDIAAPGVRVLSTIPGGGYALNSGTSMAAPHVSGAFALLWSRLPQLSMGDARVRLLGGAAPVAALEHRVRAGGRLDAYAPMAPPDTIAPAAIAELRVTRVGGEEVELEWIATGDDGTLGRAARYDLRRSLAPIDASNFDAALPTPAPLRPAAAGVVERDTVVGLSFATVWHFALRAVDELGNASPPSRDVAVTTLPPPDIGVTAGELRVTLESGQIAERTLTLTNTGDSELRFRIEAIVAGSSAPAVRWRSALDSGASRLEPSPDVRGEAPRGALAAYIADAPPARSGPMAVGGDGAAAAGLRLLIAVAGTTADLFRLRLAGEPGVAGVDVVDVSNDTPPLTALAPYDAVIVVANRPVSDPEAFGDRLADYVDGGGGLVFTLATFIVGYEVTGRLLTEGRMPFTRGLGPIGSATLGAYDIDHPIMRHVLSVSGDRLGATEVAPGAQAVATWTNGEPFVATHGERVVGINAYLGDLAFYSGDMPRIVAQAAGWAARGQWLSSDPEQGSIPPGGSLAVTARFDAGNVAAGSWDGSLEIRSNDPDEPLESIAAHLEVSGAPDLTLSAETIRLSQERSYTVSGAETRFTFTPGVPPAGPIGFELVAEGDFGDPAERATLVVEGLPVLAAGNLGLDCYPAAAIAAVDSASFATWMRDGRIDATVVNGPDVNLSCLTNRHLLTLRYPGPIDPLDFGDTFVGDRRTVVLRVGNRGTAELTLGGAVSDRSEFTPRVAEAVVPPHGSRAVAVEFVPTAPGEVTGTLRIASDDPDTPIREVRLVGRGRSGPRARVEPDSLVATLLEGGEATRTLRVTNDGGSPLHVRVDVRAAVPVGAIGDAEARRASAGARFAAAEPEAPPGPASPETQSVRFDPLASSPTPVTCLVEDPAHGALYAQEEGGRRFYRYTAAADRWDELRPAPIAARNNGGGAMLRGRVYLGYTAVSDSITVYDVASDTWSTRAAPVSTTGGVASDETRYLYAVQGSRLVRYDPETEDTAILPPAPFLFDTWCSLRWFEGALYGHEGGGRRRFARYDVARARWESLPDLPGGAVLGAAIDRTAREYLACGPAGGTNLYRYSLATGSWTVSALTPFAAADGGMGWLPGPVPGVCVSQGEAGSGLARFVNVPEFVVPDSVEAVVAPGATWDVPVTLRAGSLTPAGYAAVVAILTDDPARPAIAVPVRLTVSGAPRLSIAAEPVSRVSVVDYFGRSARTLHDFALDPAPAGGATLRLEAEGDFFGIGDAAAISVGGRQLGSVAAFGMECERASGTFPLARAELEPFAAAGVLRVQVQNTLQVDPIACVRHRHRVILTYPPSATTLAFGDVGVGADSVRSLVLANAGSAPLEIASIVADPPAFTVDVSSLGLGAGEQREVRVRFAPAAGGPVAGTLTVIANDAPATHVVSLAGAGHESPRMRVEPTSLVASTLEGSAAVVTLDVANDGRGPLTLRGDVRYAVAGWAGAWAARSSSPAALTCVTADPATGALYAQEYGGTRFFRYVAAEDRWLPLAAAPFAARNNGGAAFAAGRVYVAYADEPAFLAVYDVATDAWTTVDHPLGRATSAIAADGAGALYLARGNEVLRWDPRDGASATLPPCPTTVELWGTLVWFDGALYAQRGSGTAQWSRWRAADGAWRRMPDLPGGALVGAAIDPVTREYVASGSYDERNVYRFSLDRETWTVATQPRYQVADGGMAWLPEPTPGVYMVQGERGPGLSLWIGAPPYVTPDVVARVVPPGGVERITLRLGAPALPAGTWPATLRLSGDDREHPSADVAIALELRPRGILEVRGPRARVTSRQPFLEPDATTRHRLEVTEVPSGPGTLEVTAEGDFGDASEFASVAVEGVALGDVGGGGGVCDSVTGRFTIAAPLLAALLEDGAADVTVRNSAGARPDCAVNAHTATLSFGAPPDPLEAGVVFLGLGVERVLTVANPGSLPLTVSAGTSDAAFAVDAGPWTIPPGGERPLAVRFEPRTIGPVAALLTLRSDDPLAAERSITLTGAGATPPDLVVAPESLAIRLGAGLVATRRLTLRNAGGAELRWSARAVVPPAPVPPPPAEPLAVDPPLEEVLRDLDARHGEITAPIPDRYDFLEGVTGTGITDGGGDMYDGGNVLSTNRGGPLPYSDAVIRTHAAFGSGGRYFTRKLPGLFVLAADLDGVTEFDVAGNLGGDGAGRAGGASLYAGRGATTYLGLCKRVWGARHPSVNHLVVIPAGFGPAQSFPPGTDDDAHHVTGLAGVGRLYFLLFSARDGGLVDDAAATAVMERFLDAIGAPPSWLSVDGATARLSPGADTTLALELDTSLLGPGEYRAAVRLDTNVPGAARRESPVRLRVVDTPVVEVDADTLAFPELPLGAALERTLVVSSWGASTLSIGGAGVDGADFTVTAPPATLEPSEEARLRVTFSPRGGGVRRATLTLRSDDPERPERAVALVGAGPLAIGVTLAPRAWNEAGHGRWVRARLFLPPPLGPDDISVPTVRLAGVVPVDAAVATGAADDLAFDRAASLAALPGGDRVAVTITGALRDGRAFVGVDTVRVLHGGASSVAASGAAVTGAEAPPAEPTLASTAPNPFATATRVRYGLPRATRVRLEVFDVAGRRRRVLADGVADAGWHDLAWDGRDASGRPVAAGTFVLRLEAGSEVRTRRVVRTAGHP